MPEPFEIPDWLEGSILGDLLKLYPAIEVAPLIGVNFCEPWFLDA
jgi:hypothetical protein